MYISKIYLGDNFVPDIFTDQYRRKQIHAEVTLKEGDSLSEAEAIGEAYIKDYIYRNTVSRGGYVTCDSNSLGELHPSRENTVIAEIQTKEPEPTLPDTRTQEQKQIDLINSFTTLPKPDGLESMYLVVKNKPELLEAYNIKHAELSNQ